LASTGLNLEETTMSLMTELMLAAALVAGGAPDMRVEAQGLNMARPGEALILAERIRVASRDWCALHRAVLTPDSIGDPSVCEREMRRRASHALPWPHRVQFVRAGGQTALNRP
jgi:UrcA family protein